MFNGNSQRWISLQRCFSNFKVCTLILMMNLGIMILILPIVVGIQQVNMNLINLYFEEFAINTFMRQNYRSLTSIMSSYVAQFADTMNRTEKALTDLQRLYIAGLSEGYSGVFDPDMCHTQFDDDDSYQYAYQGFCVNIFDIDFQQYDYLPERDQFFIDYNYVSMLNEYLLPLDPSQQFLPDNIYFSKIDREFTAWWPQWNRMYGYHPPDRPWYQQHLEQYKKYPNQSCFHSDLYQFFADYTIVAMTTTCSLLDDKNNLIGILASDQQFLNNYYKYPRLNIMIVASDGFLIMTTYQNESLANSTIIGKIQDENITGFNSEDWQQIQNYASSATYTSNCVTFPVDQDILCRYNTLFECDIIMTVSNLSSPNFTFIIFNNLTDEIQQLLDQRNLVLQINTQYYQNVAIFLMIGIFLIFTSLICVWIIFLPLNDLIKHSKAYLKSNSHKLLFKQKEYYLYNFYINGSPSNNVLLCLKLAYKQVYHRISQQKFTKCSQCQIIQRFQYPCYHKKIGFSIGDFGNLRIIMSSSQILRQIIQPAFAKCQD